MPKPNPADELVGPYTVVALYIEAFQRIRALNVTPTATGLIPVRGPNGAGKSSTIGSMLEALGAERSALPITEGEHATRIRLDLGSGLVIEEKITREASGSPKRSLAVFHEGRKLPSPASVLKALRSHFADPVAFLEAPPEEQVRTVLAVLGLDGALDELQGRHDAIYDERRDLGREADRAKKAAVEAADALLALPQPPEPGALQAAAEALRLAEERKAARDAGLRAMAEIERRGNEYVARVAELKAELERAEGALAASRGEYLAAKELHRNLPIPEDIDSLRVRLVELEEAAKTSGKVELAEQLAATAREAEASHELAERRLQECRREIAELLGGVEFPVEGMTYDHEAKVLKIGAVPFAQASQAERLRAAAAVAMAGDPRIRVLFVREGSLLDSKSTKTLADLAAARGWQLWLEVVDDTPEGAGLYIDDGELFEAPDLLGGKE